MVEVLPKLSELEEEQAELVPIFAQVPFCNPAAAYGALRKGAEYSFLLESAEGAEKLARYSFIGANPEAVLSFDGRLSITGKGALFSLAKKYAKGNPVDALQSVMGHIKVCEQGGPAFFGGAVGFLSYDFVRRLENIPDKNKDPLSQPEALFMLFRDSVVVDHVEGKTIIFASALREGFKREYAQAKKRIQYVARMISQAKEPKVDFGKPKPVVCRSNLTRDEFVGMVSRAKEHIFAGDIVQTVLSRRIETDYASDPFLAYLALKKTNPSPYMYYLELGGLKIAGTSPEMLIRVENRIATTRPIAGTRPRGKDPVEDVKLETDLLADPKERAEHVMLVDLARNDLGRVCKPASVKVTDFMGIEKYSHVQHIVSNVEGVLRDGHDSYGTLKACFPAGTVSGAPKVKAMEIIDNLENTRRGIYAGGIGYFSFTGNMDTAIAIRTLLFKGKKAYVQAGAGIVADSVPEKEFEETENKGRGMIRAIELALGAVK